MEDKIKRTKAMIAVCAIAFLTLVSSATSPALAVIGDNCNICSHLRRNL